MEGVEPPVLQQDNKPSAYRVKADTEYLRWQFSNLFSPKPLKI